MSRDYLLATVRGDRVLLLGFSEQGPARYQVTLELSGTEKGERFLKAGFEEAEGHRWLQRKQLRELLMGVRGILSAGLGELERPFAEALSAWNLKPRPVEACRICLLKGEVRLHDDRFVHRKGGRLRGGDDEGERRAPAPKELICPRCAAAELERELDHRGISSSDSRRRAARRLAETRDLDLVVSGLFPGAMGNATRYDVISAVRVEPPIKTWDEAKLPKRLRQVITREATRPMPVQSLALGAGLLERRNLLVVSATATGKTLVGELAGAKAAMEGRGKMLFIVPLVALANQKYDELSRKYEELGLTTALRVGASRVRKSRRKHRASLDSDFIVGTYEGIDHLLRTGGKARPGKVATVVVDEVHLLADEERGHRLDGVVARLRLVYPKAQFIYLSATVGGPQQLARALDAQLVEYEHRPVPIERHLMLTPVARKSSVLSELVRGERKRRSSRGRLGQVLVFTDSRRNCTSLAAALGHNAAAYHAGLPYQRRRQVESAFIDGRLHAVVSTAALAAGVDFPASMVVFESLRMGIKWLTPTEFHQMQGRAGRPSYHDIGRVVILADPNNRPDRERSEEQAAHHLLSSGLDTLKVSYDSRFQSEEVMACMSVASDTGQLGRCCEMLLGLEGDMGHEVGDLISKGLAEAEDGRLWLTPPGGVAVAHFLEPSTAARLVEMVMDERHPLDIVAELAPFDGLHSRLSESIAKSLGYPVPSRIFSGGFLEILSNGEVLVKLDTHTQEWLLDFATRFLRCECDGAPHCPCAQREFTREVLDIWAELRDVNSLIRRLEADYAAYAYEGDLIDYLDDALRLMEAVGEVAAQKGKTDIVKITRGLLG